MEFGEEEIEQSIPERFEKIVRHYPDRLAVKAGERALTVYDNFFDLGCYSNAATRVISRVTKIFEIDTYDRRHAQVDPPAPDRYTRGRDIELVLAEMENGYPKMKRSGWSRTARLRERREDGHE